MKKEEFYLKKGRLYTKRELGGSPSEKIYKKVYREKYEYSCNEFFGRIDNVNIPGISTKGIYNRVIRKNLIKAGYVW